MPLVISIDLISQLGRRVEATGGLGGKNHDFPNPIFELLQLGKGIKSKLNRFQNKLGAKKYNSQKSSNIL